MPAEERLPRPAKPSHGNGDCFDAIDAPITFERTTEKKIVSFKSTYRARDYGSASSVMCGNVNGANCPACRECRFSTLSGVCWKTRGIFIIPQTTLKRASAPKGFFQSFQQNVKLQTLTYKCKAKLRRGGDHTNFAVNLKAINFCAFPCEDRNDDVEGTANVADV